MRWMILALAVATPAPAETVVAARTVRAQSIVGPADLAVVDGTVAGALRSADEALGKEARVVLYAGRPIRPTDLGPPAVIDRNQIVTLVYARGALTISAEGRALGRAGVGDTLRAMNLGSRSIVTGRVAPDAAVIVSPAP